MLLTLYLCVISGQKHPSDISVFDLMGIDTFMCNFRTKTPLFSPTPLAQYLSLHSGLPLFVILLQQSTPQHSISIHKLHILMMFSIFSMFNIFNVQYFQYFHKSILKHSILPIFLFLKYIGDPFSAAALPWFCQCIQYFQYPIFKMFNIQYLEY